MEISLRPLKYTDRFTLFSIYSNPIVTLPAGFKPVLKQSQVDETLKTLMIAHDQKNMAITLDDKMVGIIGCDLLEKGVGMFNYVLAYPYWHQGYGTRACALYLKELKKDGFHTIYADCFLDNVASYRILEKNGFTYLQDFERAYPDFDEPKLCHLYMKKL